MPVDPQDIPALVTEVAAQRAVDENAVWPLAERELLRLAFEVYGQDARLAVRHEAFPDGPALCLEWVPASAGPRFPLQRFPARAGGPPLAAPIELSRIEKKRDALARKVRGTLPSLLRQGPLAAAAPSPAPVQRRPATVADVRAAFESVPELSDGSVQIVAVAGEIGGRLKIAVSSTDPEVDPIGALIGMRGARIEAALRTLQATVDLVPASRDPMAFLTAALRPCSAAHLEHDAETASVLLRDPVGHYSPDDGRSDAERRAAAVQSIRLAGELTGLRISTSGDLRLVPYTKEDLGG